ncbi:hypothetical protein SJZ70_28105, partial [Klebsiella pneumoniae]|uniref:hypothetical protein n=1 Tax=Klebsiella pneumoniae TaxID=573 RepID=UPI0029D7D383
MTTDTANQLEQPAGIAMAGFKQCLADVLATSTRQHTDRNISDIALRQGITDTESEAYAAIQ